ncbi:MAG: UDP-N-acetylmuramate dehydrogenase [Muribaculum sp.]|nr:UDP-N-acetylmuramate dehydrogenase [Muribaculum sp.]
MIQFDDFDLSRITTFHLPARAYKYIEYTSVDELKDVLCKYSDHKIFHIGGGSNILFTGDYDGVVLHSAMKGIEIIAEYPDGSVSIEALSATIWDDFVGWTVERGLYGAENLSGIPGEVGASAIQNIGAYGVEAKDLIESVKLLDRTNMETVALPASELGYDYRHSIFKTPQYRDRYIVTSVIYRLSRNPHFTLTYGPLRQIADEGDLTLAAMRQRIIAIRDSKLPNPDIEGNAGSFFKNPVINSRKYHTLRDSYPDIPGYELHDNMVKIPAAWLIEHSGMKGASIGDAMVYPRQCLVIINRGKATSSDVVALCRKVQSAVADKFAIDLQPEVIFV